MTRLPHLLSIKDSHWSQKLSRELSEGQRRQPYGLHGANNAFWLEARGGTVFVGTRLGLFAVASDNGRLLWYALPDVDLSFSLLALPSV